MQGEFEEDFDDLLSEIEDEEIEIIEETTTITEVDPQTQVFVESYDLIDQEEESEASALQKRIQKRIFDFKGQKSSQVRVQMV